MNEHSKTLPDVAFESGVQNLPLAWVGMNEIELPLRVAGTNGESFLVPARAEVKVRLETADRGIHMSRLFVALQEEIAHKEINSTALEKLTEKLLSTQKDLSSEVYVCFKFELPLEQPSLLSEYKGWRTYPITLSAYRSSRAHVFKNYIEALVTYSSTCPASAALARQINSQNFAQKFSEADLNKEKITQWLQTPEGMAATPHAQRSTARVRVEKLKGASELSPASLVHLIEEALQTAVQSTVKREDEQEFARRNAQNLMFCEDAARRVQKALISNSEVADFYGEFQHLESLHPHNAVSHIHKNTQGLNSFAIPQYLE